MLLRLPIEWPPREEHSIQLQPSVQETLNSTMSDLSMIEFRAIAGRISAHVNSIERSTLEQGLVCAVQCDRLGASFRLEGLWVHPGLHARLGSSSFAKAV